MKNDQISSEQTYTWTRGSFGDYANLRNVQKMEEEAEGILQDAEKVVEDVHSYEDKKGFEQSDWGWGPSEETKNKQQAAWNYIKENIVDPISSAIKEYQSNK